MNIVNLEDVILNVGFNNDVLFRLTGRKLIYFSYDDIYSFNKKKSYNITIINA